MANGGHGPIGAPAVPLAVEEVKPGAEIAIIQHPTLEEQLVWGQHQRNKTVPPKIAQLVCRTTKFLIQIFANTPF